MAALKIGLTTKLWCGFRVLVYASRKEEASSSLSVVRFLLKAWAVKSRPLHVFP